MSKRIIPFGIVAVVLLIFAVSCEKGANEMANCEIKQEIPAPKHKEGILKGVTHLSESDAVKVANMFMSSSGSVVTKSLSGRSVRSIVPVNGEDGTPAFYAINYEDGFLWVAATKKLYPILAVVEHGAFDTAEDVGMGIDLVKERYVEESDSLTFETIPAGVQKAWLKYEERNGDFNGQSVKAKIYNDDYQNALDEMYSYALNNGYDVYKLDEMVGPQGATSDLVPEDLLNSFYQLVIDDYTFGVEYTFHTAYVLKKEYMEEEVYGPFTKTRWNQIWPYNSCLDNPDRALGCVTIATAQFMRYFEKPAAYDVGNDRYYWKDMPDYIYSNSNPKLASVLADLRIKLKIDDSGNGYMKDAVSLLNSYGYNVSLQEFSSALNIFLTRKNIAILCGVTPGEDVGHAWVCDGLHEYRYFTDYKLFALDWEMSPEYSYSCISDSHDEKYGDNLYYYHMNWGWGGLYDGWFYEKEWNPGPHNFSLGRGMIVAKIYK